MFSTREALSSEYHSSTLPFIPASSHVIGLIVCTTLYVLPGAVYLVNAHELKVEAVTSINPLLIYSQSDVALSPVSEGLNGQWLIPLISMFPCFHIVYGWCKLLVCSLIPLICSFHMASGDLDTLAGKKTDWRLVNSCFIKGCSLTYRPPSRC